MDNLWIIKLKSDGARLEGAVWENFMGTIMFMTKSWDVPPTYITMCSWNCTSKSHTNSKPLWQGVWMVDILSCKLT